jgi:hypothetical protein
VEEKRSDAELDDVADHDSAPRFSDAEDLCFSELCVVLFRAELLVPSVGRAWALLRAPNLAASFRGLNAELVVVLDVLPSASLHISNDGTAQYHDPDEAVRPAAVALERLLGVERGMRTRERGIEAELARQRRMRPATAAEKCADLS